MRAFPGEPEALRLAPFAASSGRRAGYAGRKRPGTVGLPRPSHDAAFHEETVKIGFVSLLGDSRFLYATLFYVMTSILGILALFGHFFTSKSPPVRRRGFQTCGSCRVGRLSPLALQPNCHRVG